MRTLLAVAAALLVPHPDEKDDLKKACEKTAGLASYFYQWELQTTVKDRVGKQAGAGEYAAPDLLTVRTGILEVVKKGDRARVRATKGWENPEDDPKLKEAADSLRPPHEMVAYVVDSLEKPKREKEVDLRKVKCRAWRGTLDGDGLKGLLKAGGGNLEALEKLIDWKASKTSVQILVEPAGGRLVRMTVESELVPDPKAEGGKNAPPVKMKRVVEFMELDAAKPSIVPEVKEALGIKE